MPDGAAPPDGNRQRMVVLPMSILCENLTLHFGPKPILQNASLELPDGCITGLFGPSGAGKSTLAKLLCGVYLPEGGSIIRDGALLSSPKGYDRKLGLPIQMVYQQPFSTLDPSQKLGAGFRELVRYHRLAPNRQAADKLISELLASVGLEVGILGHLPTQISGGEAQRVAIARCLLFKPKLLILDEATSMLDVSTQANVLGLVRRLMSAAGSSILLISHDWELVTQFCDRVCLLNECQIKEHQP